MRTETEVIKAIYAILNQRMHRIGNKLLNEAKDKILSQIYDKGDFYAFTAYIVTNKSNSIHLQIGSNVKHEPFVLGGKVPSWTPFAPIKAWVERKGLSWVDRKTGKALSVDQMAWMVIHKIKQKGIPARNVFAEVLSEHKSWIISQFDNIQGVI